MASANTNIPTSTSVLESVVINAPLSKVWHFIKLQDFGVFWSALSKSEVVKDASNEADVFKWTFKDGTVYEVKQEEHSVCFIFFAHLSPVLPNLINGNLPRHHADKTLPVPQPHDHLQRHYLLPRAHLLFRP